MSLMERPLNYSERTFIQEYATNGGNRAAAEKKAKLAPRSGYYLLARPDICKRITQRQAGRLYADLLPMAVDTLEEVMRDKKAPAAARVSAAKYICDKVMPADEGGKDPDAEPTLGEVSSAIDALNAYKAEKFGTIEGQAKDVTPDQDPGDSEGIFG